MTFIRGIAITLVSLLTLQACSNSFKQKFDARNLAGLFSTAEDDDLVISSVTFTNGSGQGNTTGLITTILFDSVKSKMPVASVCSTAAVQNKLCAVQILWKEVNANNSSSTAVTYDHIDLAPLTSLTNFSVSAKAPSLLSSNQIPNGTQLRIKVMPIGGGPAFKSNTYTYVQGQAGGAFNFQSTSGELFRNILEYSCHEKQIRGRTVRSAITTLQDQTTNDQREVVLASKFCVDGATQNNEDCSNVGLQQPEVTSQSYPYSLYLPSDRAGDFIGSNGRYSCPEVQESINNVLASQRPYPFSTRFALSREWSPNTPIGIQGFKNLGTNNDPSGATANTFCKPPSGQPGAQPTAGSVDAISTGCMGYAYRPNSNGSCPSFKDATGATRQTFRLRRYLLLYPTYFEGNGSVIPQPPGINVTYVIDHPVKSGDPLAPYSMLGPKPCPVAWLDRSGTLKLGPQAAKDAYSPAGTYGSPSTPQPGIPTYVATNNPLWTGKNVDGAVFPNFDFDNGTVRSCSATMPIITYSQNGNIQSIYLGTSHFFNEGNIPIGGNRSLAMEEIPIRPFDQAYSPHYEEDTSFEACAPLADPFVSPPLHFARDNQGQVSWCSEMSPSQNGAVDVIDQRRTDSNIHPGYLRPFTSHVVKRSSSAQCSASIPPNLPGNYPQPAPIPPSTGAVCGDDFAVGTAFHPNFLKVDTGSNGQNICADRTCDRTVTNITQNEFAYIPLLAPPEDVENLLRSDKSYNCTITFDDGNGKSWKETPTDGCAATNVVQVPSGGTAGPTAHHEPNRTWEAPNY